MLKFLGGGGGGLRFFTGLFLLQTCTLLLPSDQTKTTKKECQSTMNQFSFSSSETVVTLTKVHHNWNVLKNVCDLGCENSFHNPFCHNPRDGADS